MEVAQEEVQQRSRKGRLWQGDEGDVNVVEGAGGGEVGMKAEGVVVNCC